MADSGSSPEAEAADESRAEGDFGGGSVVSEVTVYPADFTDLSVYGFPKPPEFLRSELTGLYAELAELAERVVSLVLALDAFEVSLQGVRGVLL